MYSTKIEYINAQSLEMSSCERMNLPNAHQTKKAVQLVCDFNNNRVVYTDSCASSESTSCNEFGVGTKLKESTFKNNNESHYCKDSMVFVDRMWPSIVLVSTYSIRLLTRVQDWYQWWWSPFAWMVDVVL